MHMDAFFYAYLPLAWVKQQSVSLRGLQPEAADMQNRPNDYANICTPPLPDTASWS